VSDKPVQSDVFHFAQDLRADWFRRCEERIAAGELVRLPDSCGEPRYAVAGSPLALAAEEQQR
jgi:hypothetical protein